MVAGALGCGGGVAALTMMALDKLTVLSHFILQLVRAGGLHSESQQAD